MKTFKNDYILCYIILYLLFLCIIPNGIIVLFQINGILLNFLFIKKSKSKFNVSLFLQK